MANGFFDSLKEQAKKVDIKKVVEKVDMDDVKKAADKLGITDKLKNLTGKK